jgi:MFS family permease
MDGMRSDGNSRLGFQTAEVAAPGAVLTDAGGPPRLSSAGIAVLIVGVFVPQATYFIVNVALPTIARSLHASSGALELVIAGYGTVYAALLVVGGRLGDIAGRRRVLSVGLGGFILASLACGFAPDVWFLVGARLVQGAFAALIVPQVLATFHATLAGAKLHRAQSLYGAAAGLAIAVGQLVGGLLVTINIAGTTWRPVFWVNVPIGLATLIAAQRYVPSTRSEQPPTIDSRGTLLFAATLVALLVPLAEGQAEGWPAWTWVALACVPFFAFLTIGFERRFENSGRVPLLPPSLLSIPSMRRGLLLQLLFMLGYGAFMFVFALTVQDGLRADPLHSGFAITPMAVAFFVASLLTPRIMERFGGRRTVAVGAAVNVIGLIGLILTVAGSWPRVSLLSLAPSLVVTGFGQALVFVSLFRLVLANVPPHHGGVGGGALVTIQQSGLAIGVATLGTLYLSLDTHSISEAFTATTAAEAAVLAVLGISSRFIHATGTTKGGNDEQGPRGLDQ